MKRFGKASIALIAALSLLAGVPTSDARSYGSTREKQTTVQRAPQDDDEGDYYDGPSGSSDDDSDDGSGPEDSDDESGGLGSLGDDSDDEDDSDESGDDEAKGDPLSEALSEIEFDGGQYVSLGDSYSAMGSPIGSANLADDPAAAGCVRSADGLGPQVAKLVGADLVNASCSGALPSHYWNSQNGAPPQRDALNEDTRLVTMTMGGNMMIPLSMANPLSCGGAILKDFVQVDDGALCEEVFRKAGVVEEVQKIWEDVKEKAPNAKLLHVGYLRHEVDRGLVPIYNKLVREAAENAGVEYVDPGVGMDLTGFIQGGMAMHPSAAGQRNAAAAVAESLGL